ncbi:MAG: alpha/beta hydrolase [Halobacteriaceae archaeon]
MADLPLEHRSRPPETHTGDPSPAAVVVHGLGADEGDLLPLATRFPDGHHVLSVRAPDPHGPGFSWFDFDGGDPADARPVAEDFRRSRDLLDRFVDAAVERYGLDAERVGLFGFSQGAVLGMGSLVEAPERYAWAVAAHGFYPDDCVPAERIDRPVFVSGGAVDAVVPPERAERAADRLREVGCDVTERTYETGHRIDDAEADDAGAWMAKR